MNRKLLNRPLRWLALLCLAAGVSGAKADGTTETDVTALYVKNGNIYALSNDWDNAGANHPATAGWTRGVAGNFRCFTSTDAGVWGDIQHDNNNLIEHWTANGVSDDVLFFQEVTLPAGTYKVKAKVFAGQQVGGNACNLYLFAADKEKAVVAGTMADYETEAFTLAEAGSVTVGLKAGADNGYRWVGLSDLHLISLSGVEAKYADEQTSQLKDPDMDAVYGNWSYNVEPGGKTNSAIEYYDVDAEISQTVTGLPNGEYLLVGYAFSSTADPYMLANDERVTLKQQSELDACTANGYLNRNAFSYAADIFKAGTLAANELPVVVTDGTLKVGFHATKGAWVPVGGMRLFFQGDKAANYQSEYTKWCTRLQELQGQVLYPLAVRPDFNKQLMDGDASAEAINALKELYHTTVPQQYQAICESAQALMDKCQQEAEAAEDGTALTEAIATAKTAVEAAESPEAVTAAAEALEAARRSFVQTAMLKADAKIGFDMTFLTDAASWYAGVARGNFRGGVINDGVNGEYAGAFQEIWSGSALAPGDAIYRNLYTLRNGRYRLESAVFASFTFGRTGESAVRFFANETEAPELVADKLNYRAVECTVTNGFLRVGARTLDGNEADWIGLADMTMTYLGELPPSEYAGNPGYKEIPLNNGDFSTDDASGWGVNGGAGGFAYGVGEYWNRAIDMWQDIAAGPAENPTLTAGVYRLTVSAFYRNTGTSAEGEEAYLNGTEEIAGRLIVNNLQNEELASIPLASFYSYKPACTDGQGRNNVAAYEQGYVNNLLSAGMAFAAGHYRNELIFTLTPEQAAAGIRIVLKTPNGNQPTNWCAFDNFKLERIQKLAELDFDEAGAYTQAPEEDVYACVTMKRKMAGNGQWNPVCLPFDLTAEQAAEKFSDIRMLTGVTEGEDGLLVLNFTAVADGMKAGTPYMVKALDGATTGELKFDYVTVKGGQAEPAALEVEHGVKMQGNYAYTTIQNTDACKYYFINANTFWTADAETTVKGFRAYITLEQGEEAAGVRGLVMRLDDSTTGLVETEAAATGDTPTDVYSLSGVLLRNRVPEARALDGLSGGVYIVNRKKVIK